MESPKAEESPPADPFRVLFVMAHAGYSRNFESTIRLLAERGHTVHVAFDRFSHIATDQDILARLEAEHPSITSGITPLKKLTKRDSQVRGGIALRRALDHLHYFDPSFRDAPRLRRRAADKAPDFARSLSSHRYLRAPLRLTLEWLHARALAARAIVKFIREQAPDVVMITPLIEIGSPQVEYVRAARTLAIPVIHCVASWDNLTTKGRIVEPTDVMLVWNEAQREEAVRLHGVPSASVVVTGAGTYDQWFDRRPSTTRSEFCAKVGLPDTRPFVLYLGSSEFIAPDERRHVVHWLERFRASPVVRDLAVLLRPHPTNALLSPDRRDELSTLLESDPATVAWPPDGANPTTAQARQDYFDTLYHAAAAVGVNTSGLVECTVVGCPVFTLATADFRDTQGGTLHFHHLADAISGTATNYDEHFSQLAAAAMGDAPTGSVTGFVERFVRPHGLDEPATPRMVQAVERLLASPQGSRPAPIRASRIAQRVIERLGEAELQRPPRPRSPDALPVRGRRRTELLRVLFVMHYPGYLRYFDSTLSELVRRGHTVDLCFDSMTKQAEGLEVLEQMPPGVRVIQSALPGRIASERNPVRAMRRIANYFHYLDPQFADALFLRARAQARLPKHAASLGRIDTLPRPLLRVIRHVLVACEEALPTDGRALRLLRRVRPDVVVVSPLVVGVSSQSDLVHAARAAGIPTGLAVASWDHLTTKGTIRVVPEHVYVWNDAQREEAATLHRVPRSRLVVTGAQPFDKWFSRDPSIGREEFSRKVGLDASRRFVLFVGSTASISPPELEQRFVREWLRTIRASSDPGIGDVGILVRPHPFNHESWAGVDLAEEGFENAVVWPRHDVNPVSASDRVDYFDSLSHAAAVVGINTSAMIEAAIVGTPVLTVADGAFSDTQDGTLHFKYLMPEHGGFVDASSSLREHVEQLASILDDPSSAAARLEQFVARFVRPLGLDGPATVELVDAIVATAQLEPKPARRHRLLSALWARAFQKGEEKAVRRKRRREARAAGNTQSSDVGSGAAAGARRR